MAPLPVATTIMTFGKSLDHFFRLAIYPGHGKHSMTKIAQTDTVSMRPGAPTIAAVSESRRSNFFKSSL